MMFIASTGIAWPLHKILTFHVMFLQAIDNDMHMNVATRIVYVCMSADQSLMAGENFPGILQSELLCWFSGQSAFLYVLRIKT